MLTRIVLIVFALIAGFATMFLAKSLGWSSGVRLGVTFAVVLLVFVVGGVAMRRKAGSPTSTT